MTLFAPDPFCMSLTRKIVFSFLTVCLRIRSALCRARIFKRLWSQGIDSQSSIPPAYVAWRAGTITLFLLGA